MKSRPKNIETSFLTKEENESLFSLLGKDRVTLSTTLVRVLLSETPNHLKWQMWCTGIACFVKDYEKKMFFICVYDSVERKMLWIQNMSEVFECKSPQKLFLQFKGEEYSAGLQFVNETEAQHMVDLIRQVIDKQSALKKEITFKQKRRSLKERIGKLFSRPGKSKKLTIVHESLDKPSFVTDVVYTEVLCRPKPNPMIFESVIVNNLFKPIDKLHPPVPRRFTRL